MDLTIESKNRRAATCLLLIGAMAITGCGQKSAPTPTPPASAGSTDSLMPLLAPDAAPPPAPPGVGDTAAGGTSTPVAPVAIDFATADRPIDASGKALGDVEWLNQIVEGYQMQNVAEAPTLPTRKFNSPEEEFAAYSAAMEQHKTARLRDLSDLVKAGVIKSIPAAPAGKKYALDPETGRVVMVDQ
ncbi:MAG: hypothetical protein AB1705_10085 [Verrucomicrobiota bacterium]